MYSGLNQQNLAKSIQIRLRALRDACAAVEDLHTLLAGMSSDDLVALGFTADDASMILSGVADANAVAQVYSTGLPPSTYPQPASAYVYAASQVQIVGA